ncbi:MAG: glycoside hydrolase family 97 N-terminal domain-containing protein [Clostridiales bacterium]|nr:glycoside hydrolase family 97 N-terminal domain-containing protein [Clostridiales bacterium]
MMRSLFAALPLLAAAAAPAFAQDTRPEQTASSPDGGIVLTVSTDNDQRPTWSLSRKGKLLIAPSKLGFILADRIGLQRGFAIESRLRRQQQRSLLQRHQRRNPP